MLINISDLHVHTDFKHKFEGFWKASGSGKLNIQEYIVRLIMGPFECLPFKLSQGFHRDPYFLK